MIVTVCGHRMSRLQFFRDTDTDKLPFCSLLCSILATCGRLKKKVAAELYRLRYAFIDQKAFAREQSELAVC